MKLFNPAAAMLAISGFAAISLIGCSKEHEATSQSWTRPIKIAESWDGIIGSANIYRWNTNIIALVPQRERWAKCLIFNAGDGTNSCWTEVPIHDIPNDCLFGIGMDQATRRVSMQHGSMEEDQLRMYYIIASLAAGTGFRIISEKRWTVNQKALFGETASNVTLAVPGYRAWPLLGRGILDGLEIYIPYSLNAESISGNTVSRSHFHNGVFHSVDGGTTWQIERISDFHGGGPSICRTAGAYYFLVTKYPGPELWFSRKPTGVTSWDAPQVISKSFAKGHGGYVVRPEGDTVHLCWLDSRHEKSRLNLQAPYRMNYEVAYCRRQDSDADWSKDVILSEGLFYSYVPSMSVEGDKIVVTWAGFQTAPNWHSEDDRNDIYYVTSKDAGKTWTKPLKVTDGAKAGITSGKPQVVLLNGLIHLLYVEGKLNLKEESPGLTKLNQPPWPILYQQRPFPD